MRKIDTYELAKELRKLEVRQLKEAVSNYGGKVTFQNSDDDEETADVNECPCVMVNTKYAGPQDCDIHSVEVNEDGSLHIVGEYIEDFEEYDIDEDDIAVGHITFITELVPHKPNMKKVWLRLGVEINATDEEVENIFNGNEYGKFLLRQIVSDGRFSVKGLTVVQEETIENFNTEHGTNYNVADIDYDF